MFFRTQILPSDITEFLYELYLLLHAKTSLLNALALMQQDQEKPSMTKLVSTLHDEVKAGKNLAAALSQYPNYFESFVLESLKLAKTEAMIAEKLQKIVAYRHARDGKDTQFNTRIKGMFSYFIALLIITFLLISMMMIFVIPVFVDMFRSFGADLPVLTQAVVWLSDTYTTYWWLFLAIVVVLAWLFNTHKITVLLKLPVIGGLYHKLLMSRLFHSLAFCLNEELPLAQALKLSADGVSDKAYAVRIRQLAQQAAETSNPFQTWKAYFPKKAVHIMTVGEQTQQLPALLTELANMYSYTVEIQMDTVYRFGTALITAFVGTIIGLVVIAMYLPIFKVGAVV